MRGLLPVPEFLRDLRDTLPRSQRQPVVLTLLSKQKLRLPHGYRSLSAENRCTVRGLCRWLDIYAELMDMGGVQPLEPEEAAKMAESG